MHILFALSWLGRCTPGARRDCLRSRRSILPTRGCMCRSKAAVGHHWCLSRHLNRRKWCSQRRSSGSPRISDCHKEPRVVQCCQELLYRHEFIPNSCRIRAFDFCSQSAPPHPRPNYMSALALVWIHSETNQDKHTPARISVAVETSNGFVARQYSTEDSVSLFTGTAGSRSSVSRLSATFVRVTDG